MEEELARVADNLGREADDEVSLAEVYGRSPDAVEDGRENPQKR
jgi:hypothetical protein